MLTSREGVVTAVVKLEALTTRLRSRCPEEVVDSVFDVDRHIRLFVNALSFAEELRQRHEPRDAIIAKAVKEGFRIAFRDRDERAVNLDRKTRNTAKLLIDDPGLAIEVALAFAGQRVEAKYPKSEREAKGLQQAANGLQADYEKALDELLDCYAEAVGVEKPRFAHAEPLLIGHPGMKLKVDIRR